MTDTKTDTLKTTPLHALHRELGAKLVPFAGYDMPLQYPSGILAEHHHCRAAAGLFDVSHMGQIRIHGNDVAAALETLVPGDIKGLEAGQQRYSLFTTAEGTIRDDLMIANRGDDFLLVVNAACKNDDLAHLQRSIGGRVTIEPQFDRALLALQGPAAATVLEPLSPGVAIMPFMAYEKRTVGGIAAYVSRSGYTGEDGYEISVAPDDAEKLARLLLQNPAVKPIGLGARDSLRLEAGLCLYGQDIDLTTTPIEASLAWVIGKRRRAEGGFPGADIILAQLRDGPARKRVGLQPQGRAPIRHGYEIIDKDDRIVGHVTSGCFGPSMQGPVAMGYVPAALATPGTPLHVLLRGQKILVQVIKLPFVPARFYRGHQ